MEVTLFNQLQSLIYNYSQLDPPFPQTKNPLYSRAYEILSNKKIDQYFPDFTSILRQILLNEDYLKNAISLKIPVNDEIPEISRWRKFNFKCTEYNNYFEIKPEKWFSNIKWLGMENHTPEDNWYFVEKKPKPKQIPSDIFIKKTIGYKTYNSFAQREALASMLVMPFGSSLLVSLPTGSGKSLLFQYPILVQKNWKSVTIVIVPTTSLALDQERRIKDELIKKKIVVDHRLAWSYSLNDKEKRIIKSKIINGSQGILFVSPEAVVNNLLPSLFKAVKADLINYIVIDEAHLISEWGDSFRVEYQTLAGIRNGLLNYAGNKPFKTLLLSATFSNECLNFISNFDSTKEKPLQIISSIYLRPEPTYYVSKVNEEVKHKKVLEMLHYVPRPVIIYTSLKKDAKNLKNMIQKHGFTKIGLYDSDTSSSQSALIIKEWASNKLDFVVATSAFGVGVDKNNVRTVIHASVPETMDRYYQEVGRSGRDGNSSVSILLYSDEDLVNALYLNGSDYKNFKDIVPNYKRNNNIFIGPDTAYDRWTKLIRNSKQKKINGTNFFVLDISITGPRSNIDAQTDKNQYWNRFTLLNMAKANMIKISSLEPDKEQLSELDLNNELERKKFWDDFFTNLPIEIIDNHHGDKDNFTNKFTQGLNYFKNEKTTSLRHVFDVISKKKSVENALEEIYTLNFKNKSINVLKTCSGCPFEPDGYNLNFLEPEVITITHNNQNEDLWIKEWEKFSKHKIFLYYNRKSKNLKDNLKRALEIFVNKYDVLQVFFNDENDINDFSKDIEKMFFLDNLENLYSNEDIVQSLSNSTVTILSNWEVHKKFDSKYTKGLNKYKRNYIILPDDIMDSDNYRTRIFHENENDYLLLDNFIKRELK